MVRWNSSPHPISDIRDWSEAGRLELRPDFQRLDVWTTPARIMLMDTILRRVPMPKVFLANEIKDGRTYRIVIDGQQRLSAILAFLRDEFSLDEPYVGENKGKSFSELDREVQDWFLSYSIDFNEANNASEEEIREVYARVNKYTVPLTAQELRRADFPGDFLDVAENLAVHEILDGFGVFSPANRRRYADVEFVSELLAAMLGGIQEKRSDLDSFYIRYSKWNPAERVATARRFVDTLHEIDLIFGGHPGGLAKTRFRQKADFYSLFLAIHSLVDGGMSVRQADRSPLLEDLLMLNEVIAPESEVRICSEYAIKCVSQANSASSRRWRQSFLMPFLTGTYTRQVPESEWDVTVFYSIVDDQSIASEMCPQFGECEICRTNISTGSKEFMLAWARGDSPKQLSNAAILHPRCAGMGSDFVVLRRPNHA